MSEAEKSRRQDYRRVRKKWIAVQAVILAVAFLVAVISLSLSFLLDNEHYINYKESSKVDYGVFLKENEFYKESYLGSDKTYVASLINRVAADFTHTLNVDSTEAMNFQYTYGVEAELQIVDKLSGGVLYAPVYEVIPEKTLTADGTGFVIRERVVLNYDDYNALANRFIATYDLTGVESNIVLRMQVSSNYTEPYTSSLEIPLTTKTVHVQMAATTPAGDGQILIKGDSIASFVASVIAYVFLGVALLLGIEIVLFTYLTRNTDITYEIRVSRILKAYKSFIQKINNAFRTDGYQILMVDTFREMLEIRDTIQSPILMNENEDKTCTRFLIPTNTKLLYVYELKIEDYDEIYAQPDESSPEPEVAFAEVAPEMPAVAAVVECSVEPIAVDEPIVEEPVVEETVAEEPVAEAEAATVEPVAVIADPAEESEEASAFSNVRRSFMAKLIQCEEESKLYFSELKNSLLTYRGVKARTSWGAETFNKGRTQLAKITMRGKTLCLYLALDPAAFTDSKYFFSDMSDRAQYAAVPMMLKIKSVRGVKHAKELIAIMAQQNDLSFTDRYEAVDYTMPYQTTEELIAAGLIKDPNGEYAQPAAVEFEPLQLLAKVSQKDLARVNEQPDPILEQISFKPGTPAAFDGDGGVEVVDVVLNERDEDNELYRYDPNGADLTRGDVVLVPAPNGIEGDPIRKAAVAHAKHKVDPTKLDGPLKKVLGVLKRKMQGAISSNIDKQ